MRPLPGAALACFVLGCQSLDQFDTTQGGAYCGYLESSQFIWSPPSTDTAAPPEEGGFARGLGLTLDLDTAHLDTVPGRLTTNDGAGALPADAGRGAPPPGPCKPSKTFDHAPLRVTSQVAHDALSLMTFEDGQAHNVVAWVDSTCRGKMLAIVSLYNRDRVEVRLLKPAPTKSTSSDAFALFTMSRVTGGCPSP